MIIKGDCIEEMKNLDENSVDAIVTDPPYGLEFMGKDWDKFGKAQNIGGGTMTNRNTPYQRGEKTPPSFFQMSKGKPKLNNRWQQAGKPSMEKFDGHNDWHSKPRPRMINDLNSMEQFQKFTQDWAIECLRVLKPGGFLLSFGGTRTYHRLACGIEDAGFEIRDTIMWLYRSGFPKSLNIGKQIDKMKGAKRKVIGMRNPHLDGGKRTNTSPAQFGFGEIERKGINKMDNGMVEVTAPATKEAKEWEGWGTALKPACEPIVVARKPLSEKNVALNVLKWGTGGLNIDGCRIGYKSKEDYKGATFGNNSGLIKKDKTCYGDFSMFPLQKNIKANQQGRFPANIILDEEAGKMLDEQSGESKSIPSIRRNQSGIFVGQGAKLSSYGVGDIEVNFNDSGGASRFFYVAKASKSERNLGCEEMEEKKWDFGEMGTQTEEAIKQRGRNPENQSKVRKNNHPTVKPIKLMEYLIKLVSKEGATVLDPFLGSGTTAIACLKLNRKFIGIEKEEEYIEIAKARIKPFLEQTKLK